MGTGFEWAAFAGKLGVAQALFVYESDAALARMALSVCDRSGILEKGQMVQVVGGIEESGAEHSGYLLKHIGYEVPSVMHPLATLVGERKNSLLAVGEAIVRRAALERQAFVMQLSQQWREEDQRETVVAFTRGSRYAGERPLEHLGKDVHELRVDRHNACAMALRLKMVVERKPRLVLSDFFREQLGCVPVTVPVETWIPPLVGMNFWETLPPAESLASGDRVVVHSGAHEAILVEKGFAKERVEFRPLKLRGGAGPAVKGNRVAIIGELPSVDAERLGVTLPTHQAVNAARKSDFAGRIPYSSCWGGWVMCSGGRCNWRALREKMQLCGRG